MGTPYREGLRAVSKDISTAALVGASIALSISIAVVGRPSSVARIAIVGMVLCSGPLAPFVSGASKDVLNPAGLAMWVALALPFVALIVAYRRARSPAGTIALFVAVAYWVILGWFEAIGIYV